MSCTQRQARKSPAAALAALLLLLFAHAFVVSATHIHRLGSPDAASTEGAALARSDGGTAPAREPGVHAECLLCRLQRDYVPELPGSTPSAAAPRLDALHATTTTPPADSSHPFLVPAGRAPPHA